MMTDKESKKYEKWWATTYPKAYKQMQEARSMADIKKEKEQEKDFELPKKQKCTIKECEGCQ